MKYLKPKDRKTDCPADWLKNAWCEGVDAFLAGKSMFVDNPYGGNPVHKKGWGPELDVQLWQNWLTGWENASRFERSRHENTV